MSAIPAAPAQTQPNGVTLRPARVLLAVREQIPDSIDARQVNGLLANGGLRRAPAQTAVVYEVTVGDHRQRGVLAEVGVADYRARHIRPHEATDPDRVHSLAEHTLSTRLEQTPVLLGHASRPPLRAALAAASAHPSSVELETSGHERHRAWLVDDAELVHTIHAELAGVDTLYIADGHHRMAAADRFVAWQPDLPPDHPGMFRLGALFPCDEMRSFAYPRSVPRQSGFSAQHPLAGLRAAPGTLDISPCTAEAPATEPGVAGVFVDGQWYRLQLRPNTEGARAALDTVRLDEKVLQPTFGPTSASPVSGIVGPAALAEWCTTHHAIGFLPHPPTVPEITAVADAGEVLPPKSTWFDPKAPRGVFLRELGR